MQLAKARCAVVFWTYSLLRYYSPISISEFFDIYFKLILVSLRSIYLCANAKYLKRLLTDLNDI